MLENILIDKQAKLVLTAGTAMSEKKGKTELISNILGIDYKHCSFLECDFHVGCMSLYTNLSNMTADQSVIVGDIHGDINENLKEEIMKKIFANASLVILHIHAKEQPELKNIFNKLGKYTKARFLIAIRDSSESMTIEN